MYVDISASAAPLDHSDANILAGLDGSATIGRVRSTLESLSIITPTFREKKLFLDNLGSDKRRLRFGRWSLIHVNSEEIISGDSIEISQNGFAYSPSLSLYNIPIDQDLTLSLDEGWTIEVLGVQRPHLISHPNRGAELHSIHPSGGTAIREGLCFLLGEESCLTDDPP